MANSGSVNGVPVHASHELLTEVLRDQLGFEGVLASDWEDIWKLITVYGVADDGAGGDRDRDQRGHRHVDGPARGGALHAAVCSQPSTTAR